MSGGIETPRFMHSEPSQARPMSAEHVRDGENYVRPPDGRQIANISADANAPISTAKESSRWIAPKGALHLAAKIQ